MQVATSCGQPHPQPCLKPPDLPHWSVGAPAGLREFDQLTRYVAWKGAKQPSCIFCARSPGTCRGQNSTPRSVAGCSSLLHSPCISSAKHQLLHLGQGLQRVETSVPAELCSKPRPEDPSQSPSLGSKAVSLNGCQVGGHGKKQPVLDL